VVFTAFVAKEFTNIAYVISIGFTCAMTIAGMPERAVWVLYSAPTMWPVTPSTKGSYYHKFQAKHATNCPATVFECIL